MKTIFCKDMGVDCPWVGKAETMEELMMKTKEHAKMKHPEMWESKMKNMSDKEMEEMMKPYVKEE